MDFGTFMTARTNLYGPSCTGFVRPVQENHPEPRISFDDDLGMGGATPAFNLNLDLTRPAPVPYAPTVQDLLYRENSAGAGTALQQLIALIISLLENVDSMLTNSSRRTPFAAIPAANVSTAVSTAGLNGDGVAPSGSSDASFEGSFDPGSTGFSTDAPSGPLSQTERDTLAANVMTNLMKDLKLTPAQAAGIVGNLRHESGMHPNINEIGSGGDTYGRPNGSSFGYGWAQWTGGRKTDFLNYAREHGLDPGSPAANYGFLVHELRTSESGSLAALRQTSSPEAAAHSFRVNFERAGVPADQSRIDGAIAIYEAYRRSQVV